MAFSTTFGAPGQMLRHKQGIVSPGHYARNAFSTGYGQGYGAGGNPYKPGFNFNPSLGQDPMTAMFANMKAKQSKPRGGGGPAPSPFADAGIAAKALTPYKPPSVQSSIDYAGFVNNYMPQSVVDQNTNLDVAMAQQKASPGNWAEQLASNQNNMSSLRSGQNMQVMQNKMMPHLAQAASINANAPIDAALQRYGFQTDVLGSQARDVFGQAANEMGRYGDQLGYDRSKADIARQLAQMIAYA